MEPAAPPHGGRHPRTARIGDLHPRWGALERIAVEYPRAKEPAAIAVWFRPAAKPSKAWRNKHDVEKRQGGGVWVYRNYSTRPTRARSTPSGFATP